MSVDPIAGELLLLKPLSVGKVNTWGSLLPQEQAEGVSVLHKGRVVLFFV